MNRSAVQTGIRRLRGLLADPRGQESDEQLLRAFLGHRDDNAFAALVRRHGSMVLHVCRRVLGHQQDAEDAFQAVFLVLARNAACLRNTSALASFLHGTAYRIAMKAKRTAARRRQHEGRTPPRPTTDPSGELLWREVRTLLDEEIARLPPIYRSVFVLCCLERLSQAEVGRRLRMKERTVSHRLARARQRLQQRLARRGVELTAVLAAAAVATPPASALSPVLLASTTQAALAIVRGEATADMVSAHVADLMRSAAPVAVSKTKIATAVLFAASMLTGASVWAYRGFAANPLPPSAQPAEPPAARPDDKPKSLSAQRQAAKTVEIQGRVLDPDGKPAVGARVYVQSMVENEGATLSTTTAKDGHFSLVLPRSQLIVPQTKVPRQTITIVATAKDWGLDWREVPLGDLGNEVTLRLVKDDVPIQGRLLSLEGKPLAGVQLSVHAIEAFPKVDLSRALRAIQDGQLVEDITDVQRIWFSDADREYMARTDADGRFRLDGIGRDRFVTLHLKGPGIHYSSIRVMTRAGKAVHNEMRDVTIHGAAFDYLVRPARLIRGTVRDRDTGKSLAGIRISAVNSTAHVLTDAHGHYELPGCRKGDRYGIMAFPLSGAAYFSGSTEIKDTEGLGPLTADLELVAGIPFEGKVVDDETGKAVLGHASYYPLSPNPNVMSNHGQVGGGAASAIGPYSDASVLEDGSFHCLVLPGPGCIAFQARNAARYMSACVDPGTINAYGKGNKDFLTIPFRGPTVTGIAQEQFQAILLLDPAKDTKTIAKTIRVSVAPERKGTVLDPDGKPLTGVRVHGLETSYSWGTLAKEQFAIHGVNPLRPRRVYFIHEARHLIGTMEVKGTETKPLTVQLQPWAAVRGRLLDGEGRPLRNVRLHASEFLPQDGRTDGEGRFRLEGLIPGLRYDLTYSKDKPFMSGMVLQGFAGKAGQVHDLGAIQVKVAPDKTGE